MERGQVIVIFADATLGGTARSALATGSVWRELGYRVAFLALRGVHPQRESAIRAVGDVMSSSTLALVGEPEFIHLHHGNWSLRMREDVIGLLAQLTDLGWQRSVLITNNIFACEDSILAGWNGRKITGVLGQWALEQYRMTGLRARRSETAVIPNPQDDSFFRPPTDAERIEARQRIGAVEDERVILRLGSPLDSKWSPSYLQLAARLRPSDRLVLVGAPPRLGAEVTKLNGVTVLSPTGDDEVLRQLYWAADVFALDAARGESFGNVILESLLCGVPVVYRARELRDNTPWEFQRFDGFAYVTSSGAWVDKVLRTAAVTTDAAAVARCYGRAAVASTLSELARRIDSGARISAKSELSTWQRAAISLRHNFLATQIKRLRVASHRN